MAKSNNVRYPGIDPIPWVIKDASGKRIGNSSYTGYKDAAGAAESYTLASGEFASAVRL